MPISLKEWEEEYAKAKRTNDFSFFNIPDQNGHIEFPYHVIHDDDVRVAYVHGKLDDGSAAFMWDTWVSKVTPEIVALEGGWAAGMPQHSGYIDRRTGEGLLMRYITDFQTTVGKDTQGNDWHPQRLHQVIQLQCKASRPKF